MTRPAWPAQSPAAACREALQAVERSLGAAPSDLKWDVDLAERAIARLRDGLIERLRRGAADGEQTRALLDRANVAISLVSGVEYPMGGTHRALMEQVRDVLHDLQARGLPE